MDQFDTIEKLNEVRRSKKELKKKMSDKCYAVQGALRADNPMGMQRHFDDYQDIKARLKELDKIEARLIYILSNRTWKSAKKNRKRKSRQR